MSHDFAAQRAETFDAFAEMIGDGGLPDVADLDFFFVAAVQPADWAVEMVWEAMGASSVA